MAEPKIARWTVVYDELKHRIQNLELAPGAHLSESAVAEQFEMSASPVRDALGRLSQEGLLTVKRGQGYTVASLTIGGISDICDLRFVLETGAARLAMERARPEQFDELRRLSALTGESGVDNAEMIQRNVNFHVALSSLAQNAKITEAVRRVMDDSIRVFHLGLPTFAAHGMQSDHDALIEAIIAQDDETMTEIVRREAYDASQRVLEQLLRHPDPRSSLLVSAESFSSTR